MNRKNWGLALYAAISIAYVSHAETTTPAPAVGAAVPTPAVAEKASAYGGVDLRPSLSPSTDTYYMENEAFLGVKFTPDIKAEFHYLFNNHLQSPEPSPNAFEPSMQGAFFRAKFSNLATEPLTGAKLGYNPRLYVPTSQAEHDAGFITAVRNYVALTKKVNDTLTLSLNEIPIFLVYAQPGVGNAANPSFENRVYLEADINFTEKLTLYFPVMFHQKKYNSFKPEATNDNKWTFFTWIYPELDYTLTDNLTVGVAYYSDNLVKPDLSGFNIQKGLENGVVQFTLQATL